MYAVVLAPLLLWTIVYADVYIYVYVYVNVQYQRKQAEYYKRIPKQINKANENPLRGTNAQRTNNARTEN